MHRIVMLSVSAAALAAVLPSPASACGRLKEIQRQMEPVDEAEEQLFVERHLPALRKIATAYPAIGGMGGDAVAGADAPTRRAAVVAAVATLRSGGRYTLRKRVVAAKAGRKRLANVQWARQVLRALHEADPEAPHLQAYFAEALAADPQTRGEARRLLRALLERDMMPDAHAWAALARVTDDADEAAREARAEAVRQCRQVASDPAICKVPETPPTSS